MNSLMEISAGVGIANVVLLIALLTVYAKVYKSTQSCIHYWFNVLCWNVNVTQYYCSLCLFCNATIVCSRITAIFRGDTYSRTSRNSEHYSKLPYSGFLKLCSNFVNPMFFIPMHDKPLLVFLQFRIRMHSEAKSKYGANSTTFMAARCIRG